MPRQTALLNSIGVTAAVLAAAAAWAPAAGAAIGDVAAIDGPSADIRELGGTAMAADGTGGVVYRKDVDGRPHIFAAQFLDGKWGAPRRVDNGDNQRFESSWPAIAAGNGGRLMVVWVQEFGASDRMFSAMLQPGARRFEAPVPVDLQVGDSSAGTWPYLSMSPGGQAWVVYRVVTDTQPSSVPPGNVLGEFRAARSVGLTWTSMGAPINRNAASGQPTPSAQNRPRIGVDQFGNAVAAWQELDNDFIPRIYARRLFTSGQPGIALQVSPATFADKPQSGGADQFDLGVGRYGDAVVGWRQQPADGSGFPRPRALAAQLPLVYSEKAAKFGDARALDSGPDGPSAGPVSVSSSDPDLLAGYPANGAILTVDGSDAALEVPERVDAGASPDPGMPGVELGASGAAAFAWRSNSGNRGTVAVRERRSDGVASDRALSAPRGGQVDDVALDGSGLGDALVGFSQGAGAGRQIGGTFVNAPPDVFNVQTPLSWVRSSKVDLEWDPSAHAIGGVTYSVVIDDDTVADGLKATKATLATKELDDGKRTVTIIATDSAGQETTSVEATLKVDRRAPQVKVTARGRSVRVSVRDNKGASGVNREATRASFGDGARAAGSKAGTHFYGRPGRYRVRVQAVDAAGNRRAVTRTVVIR
ncbi:MAG: hypothetical protein KGR19_09160 [Acidobacteria bacterium]|nr:hypothetical protein [Acidobacteriota bacterium]